VKVKYSTPVKTGPGAHPATYRMGKVSSPGAKQPGLDANPPPSSNAKIKDRIELFIYSPSEPTWPVLG